MQFEAWLRELRRARKGGVRLQPARRGSAFSQDISLPGNWSGTSFAGQVRAAPDAGGSALATFTFGGPTYNAGLDKTTVTFSLASSATESLPQDIDGDGVEDFAFDILATPSGGTQELLIAGVLPVIGRVTQ